MLVGVDGIHPGSEPRPLLGIRPASVGLQYPTKTQDPRSNLDVYERHLRSHEEWSTRIRRCDQLVKGIAQVLCVGDLFLLILLLQDAVEVWHNIAVYLALRQHTCVSGEEEPADVV